MTDDDIQAMTLRLPRPMHEQLRGESFVTRQTMNDIVLDGLRLRAELMDPDPDKYGQLCNLFEAAWHHAVPESPDDVLPFTSDEARTFARLAVEVMSR